MTLWTEQPGFPVVNIQMQDNDAVLTQVRLTTINLFRLTYIGSIVEKILFELFGYKRFKMGYTN